MSSSNLTTKLLLTLERSWEADMYLSGCRHLTVVSTSPVRNPCRILRMNLFFLKRSNSAESTNQVLLQLLTSNSVAHSTFLSTFESKILFNFPIPFSMSLNSRGRSIILYSREVSGRLTRFFFILQ